MSATPDEKKGIQFKGSTEGLSIVIPETYDLTRILEETEAKVATMSRFFNGARLKVTYRGIRLDRAEEKALFQVLSEKSGAMIESLDHESVSQGNRQEPQKRMPTQTMQRRSFFAKHPDEGVCKFVEQTVRGGTRIQYDGSVVVMGDVNPGAEIVASGNVVVLGTLRGMVHAGADGDATAFIYALKLKPTQLRIAEAIARCPDEDDGPGLHPETARIQDGVICVVSGI